MDRTAGLPAAGLVAFAVGVVALIYLPALPSWRYLAAWSLLALLLLRGRSAWLGWLLLGAIWHCWCAQAVLSAQIPTHWEGQTLVIEGRVASLVQRTAMAGAGHRLRFEVEVRQASHQGRVLNLREPLRVRLSWYRPVGASAEELAPNQRWRLAVRLRRPRGLANPGTFDYRLWLLAQGIGGSGKVLTDPANRLLGHDPHHLTALRYWYQRQLVQWSSDHQVAPLLVALAIGDRQMLTAEQRAVLAATGTSHLMVISGLHVGLSALVGFWGCFGLLGLQSAWVSSGRALLLARCGAFAVATLYAALAGFALPTQRALIMLALFLLARQAGREVIGLRIWLLALFAVLLWDPLAVTSAGFWLSFAAVCLLMAPQPRVVERARWRLPAWSALSAQWRLTLGLAPIVAIWLGQLSVLAPVVNLLAIPWVGFVVVPVLLLALMLLPLSAELGGSLLDLALLAMACCWRLLAWASEASAGWSTLPLYPGPLALACAWMAVTLYLLPRGLPGRVLWPVLLLPLLAPAPARVRDLELYVLDVGQGTAVVVRSADKVLVYDAGPVYASGFDTGRAVLLPFLRSLGVARVDRLIVSHGDSDHSGGGASLFAGIPIARWMAPVAIDGLGEPDDYCRAGVRWQWGDVHFHVLHPVEPLAARRNDRSCVLLIEAAGKRYLLAGDIERSAERALAAALGPGLRADVLLVPHHGSASSSSWDFAWFVQPGWAVISSGYGNHFGHPDPLVLRRYRELGAELINTADSGALRFGPEASYRPYRWFHARYWREYPCRLSATAKASWWLGGPWWPQGCAESRPAIAPGAF